MCVQILLATTKTVRHVHPILQEAIYYAQEIEREFPLVERIHETEFHTALTRNVVTGNDLVRQQRLTYITLIKC